MVRRALLIGSQTGGLTGVGNDLDAMATLLAERGFDIRRCEAAQATRAGILDAYDRLIADTQAGDPTLVFYSGHGVLARPPEPSPDSAPGPSPDTAPVTMPVTMPAAGMADGSPDLQAIVPVDYEESTEGDFRGIAAVELSVLLARLTERTRNATVVLDCCYAAHMSRDPNLVPKANLHPAYTDLAAHVRRLRADGLPLDRLDVVGNRDAVRVVACAPWESAYEYTNRDGARMGLLTESLRLALDEAQDIPVNWATLMRRIRNRVLLLAPAQRPSAEGPVSRLVFETREADQGGVLPVLPASPGRVSLPGGRVLGVEVGDEYTIMPAGSARADESTRIGDAVVSGVGSIAAVADVSLLPGRAEIPLGAQAHPRRVAGRTHPVLVAGPDAESAPIREAVALAPGLRLAEPESTEMLARVEVAAGRIVISDAAGPLTPPAAADADGIGTAVENLGRLARAATLRTIADGDVGAALTDVFVVEWGRVVGGHPVPLRPSADLLFVGQPVYLRLRNDSDRNLYFFVFDVGIGGQVTLLTDADRLGLRLEPGQEYVVGRQDGGDLEGLVLEWPDGVPADGPRPESLLVIVTSTPQDLGVLEQEGVRTPEAAVRGKALLESGSELEQLLAQLVVGGVRDVRKPTGAATIRYAVRHFDFQLHPAPAPAEETPRFLIDERPDPSVRLLGARGSPAPAGTAGRPAPTTVAVQLGELIVHRNRALLGADVRVDAVVLTGGPLDVPVYRAGTTRFPRVRDGDRLPLDRMLLYHGPATDFLDLAVWVSRDRTDSLELNDMLRRELTAEDFRQAAAQLAGLAIAAPQAALAVAAAGAAAVIVSTAYRLLSQAVGDSVGLYRTSLLAGEGFGAGRHPAVGMLRSQDISFWYEVTGVG